MLPHILRALRILASARLPGEARIAPAIRANPEYTRGMAKSAAAGGSAGFAGGVASSTLGGMGASQDGGDVRRDPYEGPNGGYPVSLTPDEMEAIGLGRPSGMSRGYLTPAQMDQLDAYMNLTRKGYDDPRAFESDTERKIQDIMRVMSDPNWARQR